MKGSVKLVSVLKNSKEKKNVFFRGMVKPFCFVFQELRLKTKKVRCRWLRAFYFCPWLFGFVGFSRTKVKKKAPSKSSFQKQEQRVEKGDSTQQQQKKTGGNVILFVYF